jgi:hypothetical protein
VATALLLALFPVARAVPGLMSLGLVAAVCVSLIAYEALRHREERAWIRSRRGTFSMQEASTRLETGVGGSAAQEDPDAETPATAATEVRSSRSSIGEWVARDCSGVEQVLTVLRETPSRFAAMTASLSPDELRASPAQASGPRTSSSPISAHAPVSGAAAP